MEILQTIKNAFKKDETIKPGIMEANTYKPLEISLPIKYNTQRDNPKFNFIPASSQCGYTTIAMVLSQFIPEANGDIFISDIILTFEKNFINGKGSRFGMSMQNHVKIYEYYINKYKLNKEVIFIPQDGTLNDIVEGLKAGSAVEFSWMPTSSGHYSTIVGYSEIKKSLEIHDPWGKFDFTKKAYGSQSGERNIHTIDLITPWMNRSSPNGKGYRITYLRNKT